MKSKIILLLSVALIAPAWAGVLPNDAIVDGKTISEWSADWAKWVFSMPTNGNAQLDFDGAWATNHQTEGPVFFLAGIEYGGAVQRTFAVPEDRYLFVPILGLIGENIDIIPPLSPEGVAEFVFNIVTNVSELHASIDGIAVPNLSGHLALSPVFSYDFLTADNIRTVDYGRPITGLLDPIVAGGYWLMLEPLPPGTHTVHYGFAFAPPNAFFYDVTATITVTSISLSQRLANLISSVATANLPRKQTRPLLVTLGGAEKSFAKDHLKAGVQHLRAFQKKTRHEITPIDSGLAGRLIAEAQAIIDRAAQDSALIHRQK